MTRSEAGKLGAIKSKVTQQRLKEERINNYYLNPRKCLFCSGPMDYKKRDKKYRFCSQSCSGSYNGPKRKVPRQCLNCNKEIYTKRFCGHSCQHELAFKEAIQNWKNGAELTRSDTVSDHIRKYLFQLNNNKCGSCKWSQINPKTGNVPLEVDHIDGNHKNNRPENLRLLCPNCHSLTSTYKGSNMGNGRTYRKKYYIGR